MSVLATTLYTRSPTALRSVGNVFERQCEEWWSMSRASEQNGTESVGAIVPEGSLELASAVEAIRGQLSEAMERAEAHRLQFELGDIEIEFTVTLTDEAKIDGGVKVWVLNAGGSTASSTAAAHRVKLTLKPRDMHTGRSPQVADTVRATPPR
jgi:hypothetical protein